MVKFVFDLFYFSSIRKMQIIFKKSRNVKTNGRTNRLKNGYKYLADPFTIFIQISKTL